MEPFVNVTRTNFDINECLWLTDTLDYVKPLNKTREEIINHNINIIRETNYSFIMKIIPTQIPHHIHLLNDLPNTKYHFLYRENIVDSILSRCLAEYRNVYNADKPIDFETFDCKKVSIDRQFMEYIELRTIFKSRKYDVIHRYEDGKMHSENYVKLSSYEEKKEKCINSGWVVSYILDLCEKNGFKDGKFYV